MDNLVLLGVLLFLTVVVGSFMGIFAFAEVKSLRGEVRRLRAAVESASGASSESGPPPIAPAAQSVAAPPIVIAPVETPSSVDIPATGQFAATSRHKQQDLDDVVADTAGESAPRAVPPLREGFWERVQQNWMVWLGGACVALSGIFLARYGIEQGLLGPRVRVALGLITALALYIASEVLRRRTGGSHPTFAALAGGGAITAFAAILSAVHLYHLVEPGLAFGMLAVVALLTMWLARLHGPVLAAIGMLGAYSVPVLVSTGGGNVVGAMVYAVIISVSVLLLLRHVYRSWLWLGLLAGALLWWLISLQGHQADGWRGPYLAALAYLLLSVVPGDWLLQQNAGDGEGDISSAFARITQMLLPSLLLLLTAQCLSIFREGFPSASLASALWAWSPLVLVLLIAARRRTQLAPLPWLLLLGQLAAWLAGRLDRWEGLPVQLLPLPPDKQGVFLAFLAITAALFSAFALFNYRRGLARFWWASLAVMAPLLSLPVGYLLAGDGLPLYWWCLYAAVFGAVFLYLGSRGAGQGWHKSMVVWLFIGGHFAYSLAACLWLEQASLTLALALQAVSLAWIIRKFEMPALGWLLKGVLLLVVVRLTLNPWLLSYGDDSHWSLWTYGGSVLCTWLATRILRDRQPALVRWAEAAALHLLVLALWAESRYWLYDGHAFAAHYSFTEAVINMWLFTGLGLVYYRKSLLAGSFSRWYDGYGRLLILAAVANYVGILLATAISEPWVWSSIGERPLLNMLLPAFAGPALLAWLVSRWYLPGVRRPAGLASACAAFIWISLEVRHLWQGDIRLDTSASTGELYTYSAVWLLLAVAAILFGSWRGWRSCYRGGMAVLALVIVKLFLVDMSGLEGLLRVASFMGMGLALLGIAYLHQKLGRVSAGRSP
ncbi:DUF2339 domain-containing protein [Microbulbifer pacificus]|uniref:DUF2339 domain-containing protein n=1 Tax=Microbulbifer pacificus TaxID=407164 RepID=A0AAU0MXI9_9GAMM|nr:DUF2339 domain-containing protein [Microbulbifer pacificus]WOX04921.1 DUF2339 domain-containing protein [Microbulbifer pacificus]